MPRGGRPSRTAAPSAGPSTPITTSSRFSLLQEMMAEENQWESGSDSSSYTDYENYDSDDSTVASTMLHLLTDEPRTPKKKGKGKAPAPKKITSSGGSKTPQQPKRIASEKVFTDEDQQEELPIEIVEELVGKAFISVMEGHFAKLYSKIDNLKTEVSTLKTTVASLVEENKKLGKVRGNAPDLEMQPPTIPATVPTTPKKDLTIRPRPQLQPRKRVGTPLAREVTTRNWAKQVEKDNATPMNIDESDAESGRPGKAPRLTSPPPTLMHSRYAGASVTAKRREDDRGENDRGKRTQSEPTTPRRQRRRRGRSEGSCDRVTELRNTITWRKEDNDRGGRRPGGRGGQQKGRESEASEREKEKDEQPRRSRVVTKYEDSRGVTEVYDCRGGRYESWRPRKG